METLGREPEWNRTKAERALGARLADVEKGMRKPQRRTFDDLADEFEAVALPARPRKKTHAGRLQGDARGTICGPRSGHSTSAGCRGPRRSSSGTRPTRSPDGLSPKTVRNHLVLLGLMFRPAGGGGGCPRTRSSSSRSPRCRTSGDRDDRRRRRSPTLFAAYRVLEADTDDDERFWFEAARRMTVVALSTGLRRGELLGLRWQDVDLLERRLSGRAAVRPERDHVAEVEGGEEDAPARPVAAAGARGAVPGVTAPGGRVDRVLASGARDAARPVEAHELRE